MERLLVVDDGSAASGSALEWAASRARRGQARIDILSADPGGEGAPEGTAAPGGLLVVGVDHGRASPAVVPGIATLPFGAVAVVVVPAGWVATADPVTVGVADDDSSADALAFAAREAEADRVPMRLVHAWLMPTPPFPRAPGEASDHPGQTPDEAMEQHRGALAAAAASVGRTHPRVDVLCELIRDSRSAALLRFGPRSSLIVVGTHRRGPYADQLLGAVAQGIARQAPCPVAFVPVTGGRA
ncbi:universal stress protein [Microbacterium sp.]|uniref:universal stress protein n=1 Tax=Microbacterium sp. TaxID=51671 RepID=UPI0037CAAAD2